MKKFLLSLLFIASAAMSFAQTSRYTDAMKKNIDQIDSALKAGNMDELANNFERIGDAEKTQWLPYYYASYCTVMKALMAQDKKEMDGIADKAETFITKAESLAGSENSETCVIKSMIATAHLSVNPMARYMKYGKISDDNIAKAKQLDSTNPRPIYLEGQNKFFTPKGFGGGKEKAKPYFVKASEMFDKFVPAYDLAPVWGKMSTQYFLAQCD